MNSATVVRSLAIWFYSVATYKAFYAVSFLQLAIFYSSDLPRENTVAERAVVPELDEYAEIKQIKPKTPEKLHLDVCIRFRF